MEENNLLLKENIVKLFIKYTMPALLAMIIVGVQSIIDGIFAGNFIGPNAMASINIAAPYNNLIIGLGIIFAIGSQSHIGINLGQGNLTEAKNTFQTFFRILIVAAILIMIISFTFSNQIATILGADNILLENAATYIKIYSLFSIPVCFMMYFGFLDRIVGQPELYFRACVISLITNVILNYILIVLLNKGVAGAAIATGSSFISASLIVVKPMIDKKSIINIFEGKFDYKCILPVLYNGSSEGVNSLSGSLCAFLFNVAMMKEAGASGVTAFSVINYIALFSIVVLFGISDGVGPIVSYNYGNAKIDRVKSIMNLAYAVNFIVGIIICIILYFFSEPLVKLFIKDNPEIIELAVHGGRLYAFSFLLAGFNILSSGYFTFIGKGLQSVIVAASRGMIFIGLGIAVLPMFLGIDGVWLSVAFAELCAVAIGIGLLIKNKVRPEIIQGVANN